MHNQMTHDYDWDIVANILVIDAKFLYSMGFLLSLCIFRCERLHDDYIKLCKLVKF